MPQPLYVFDAYGTLFDVNAAVLRHADAVGDTAHRLADLWRTKQLEYSWVTSLMGRKADFWSLTVRALDAAAARCGAISPDLRQRLLDSYAELDAFADARSTLRMLRGRGIRTAILSNGSPAMLAQAVAAAGLDTAFDAVLSVEAAGVFKTDPRTYALVTDRFAVTPGEVLFVSSNRWDVAGATAFGFRTVWINRDGKPDEYADLPPMVTLTQLGDLAAVADADLSDKS